MKVLFLDHDGVICLRSQWGKRFSKKSKERGEIFDPFCPKAIKVLNKIIEETDCEIVVSSDWRLYADLDYMKKLYKDRGIIKTPIAFTGVLDIDSKEVLSETSEYKDGSQIMARVREMEINKWLYDNQNISSWVAIDDLNMKKLKNFILITSSTEGIKKMGISKKIIDALNNN